jgi:7-cyano-7-deazaguanine synthase in queuosine biosynthesis
MILNLSGGIDSTFTAFKLLSEKKRLVLHHTIIKTKRDRWMRETPACQNVVNWLYKNGLDNFEYHETEISAPTSHTKMNDQYVVCMGLLLLMTGVVKDRNIAISISKTDLSTQNHELRSKRLKNMRSLFFKDIKYHYPIIDLERHEIIKAMPKELLDLTYFCQRWDDHPMPCGECKTCKETLQFL